MNPETIGAIFAGVSTLVTALGGLALLRRRKDDENVQQDQAERRYLRGENKGLKDYNLASTSHMYKLELLLARNGIDPPPRPAILSGDPDIPDRPMRDPTSGAFRLPPSGMGVNLSKETLAED